MIQGSNQEIIILCLDLGSFRCEFQINPELRSRILIDLKICRCRPGVSGILIKRIPGECVRMIPVQCCQLTVGIIIVISVKLTTIHTYLDGMNGRIVGEGRFYATTCVINRRKVRNIDHATALIRCRISILIIIRDIVNALVSEAHCLALGIRYGSYQIVLLVPITIKRKPRRRLLGCPVLVIEIDRDRITVHGRSLSVNCSRNKRDHGHDHNRSQKHCHKALPYPRVS